LTENTLTPTRTQGLPGIDQLDLDINAELARMTADLPPTVPRIRIEHLNQGNHRMYLDNGESYSQAPAQLDIPGNELKGIVIAAQNIRALFTDDASHPLCASIRDVPTVDEPLSLSCQTCEHAAHRGGKCKPKVRLLLLTTDGQLVMFPLSATSIKHWRSHLQRLSRSGAPYIAVVSRFTLSDVQRNGYRWAEVQIDFDRLITPEELETVKKLRAELENWLDNGFTSDYQDPGDRDS